MRNSCDKTNCTRNIRLSSSQVTQAFSNYNDYLFSAIFEKDSSFFKAADCCSQKLTNFWIINITKSPALCLDPPKMKTENANETQTKQELHTIKANKYMQWKKIAAFLSLGIGLGKIQTNLNSWVNEKICNIPVIRNRIG